MTGEGYLAQKSGHKGAIIPVAALHAGIIAMIFMSPYKPAIFKGKPIEVINIPFKAPPKQIDLLPKPRKTIPNADPKPAEQAYRDPIDTVTGSDAIGTETGTMMTGETSGAGDEPYVPPVANPDPPVPVIKMPALDNRFARDLQPPYPPGLRRAEIEGTVTVRVLVGTDGRVLRVEAVRADQEEFLTSTREWALRKWRFKPATRDGVPYEDWITKTVRFTMTQK